MIIENMWSDHSKMNIKNLKNGQIMCSSSHYLVAQKTTHKSSIIWQNAMPNWLSYIIFQRDFPHKRKSSPSLKVFKIKGQPRQSQKSY